MSLRYLDLSLPTPEENLGLDDALLELGETQGAEFLRTWQPPSPFVVLGRTRRIEREVRLDACRQDNIPVLRRTSGGGTVILAPGCLNFTLVFQIKRDRSLAQIASTNRYVLDRHRRMISDLLRKNSSSEGVSDLALDNLKFSGNAQRRAKTALLFHGTFLLEMDLCLVERFLPVPQNQPAYRNNRPHRTFLTNLGIPSSSLGTTLAQTWEANQPQDPKALPWDRIKQLAQSPHSEPDWIYRF